MSTVETKEATTTGVAKVEDLVKKALKVALDKRKLDKEEGIAPTEYMEVVKTVTETIESTAPAMILKENQKWFSDVIGNKLIPAEQDFCVSTFHGYDWNEAIVDFIPESDTTYILTQTSLGTSCVLGSSMRRFCAMAQLELVRVH